MQTIATVLGAVQVGFPESNPDEHPWDVDAPLLMGVTTGPAHTPAPLGVHVTVQALHFIVTVFGAEQVGFPLRIPVVHGCTADMPFEIGEVVGPHCPAPLASHTTAQAVRVTTVGAPLLQTQPPTRVPAEQAMVGVAPSTIVWVAAAQTPAPVTTHDTAQALHETERVAGGEQAALPTMTPMEQEIVGKAPAAIL